LTTQIRTGNGPQVMATLRNLGTAILKPGGYPSIVADLWVMSQDGSVQPSPAAAGPRRHSSALRLWLLIGRRSPGSFVPLSGVRQIRWQELEALGRCRGTQGAVERRECPAAPIDPAHRERTGQLDCVISPKAMRGTEPGSLIEEPARGSYSSEPWRLGVGPEVISLEIGGQQSRIVSGQFTHALLPP
jgi:hypothetical protein